MRIGNVVMPWYWHLWDYALIAIFFVGFFGVVLPVAWISFTSYRASS